jgi:mono/diheme cytochrome c family protein
MTTSLRNIALISVLPLLGIALAAGLTWPRSVHSAPPVPKWTKVRVEIPASQTPFPPGDGAVIANAQCLICHSAGMVLRQPPLTQEEWLAEINKMRNSYGAPIPADQVEPLARYLRSISALKSPAAAAGQGS